LDTSRFAAPDGNPAAVDGTFQGISQRSTAEILNLFPRDEAHFAEAGGNSVDSIDPHDLPHLARLHLVKSRHRQRFIDRGRGFY